MSRTKKHPYTKSKLVDKTCRCNGGCPWCEDNRLIRVKKELDRTNIKYDIRLGNEDTDESLDHWNRHGYSWYDEYDYYDYTQHKSFIG